MHDSLRFRQIKPPSTVSFRDVTGIQIYDHMNTCTFFSVYVPNSVPHVNSRCLNDMFATDRRVVIGGDFNARNTRWGCDSSNSRGKSLFDYVDRHAFVNFNFPNSPTYFPPDPNRKPSIIDGFLTKNVDSFGNPSSLSRLFSDHNPVVMEISMFDSRKDSDFIDHGLVRWDLFRDYLDVRLLGRDQVLDSAGAIEEGILFFEKAILASLHESIPEQRRSHDNIPPFVKAMIVEKNRIRRIYQNPLYRNVANKSTLNRLQREIDKALREHENLELRRQLSILHPYDNQLYVHLKRITKRCVAIPPLTDGIGNVLYSDEQKAACMANNFAGVHGMNRDLGDPEFEAHVSDTVDQYLSIQASNTDCIQTNIEEVRSIIKGLKGSKAPGFDQIKNVALRNLSTVAIAHFTAIANAIFRLKHFPSHWKVAKILAFPKKDKSPKDPRNYRPISLLPSLSKLIERICAIHLKSEMQEKRVLPDEQFGFRERHSTVHSLLNLTCELKRNIKQKKLSVCVSLDIEKALNTLRTNAIHFKMIMLISPSQLILFKNSKLKQRRF